MQWLGNNKNETIQLSEHVRWPKPCSNALEPNRVAHMANAIFPNSIVTGKIALAIWGILLPSDCEQVDCVSLTTNESELNIVRNEVGLFRCYPVAEAKRVCVMHVGGNVPISVDGPRSALHYTLQYQRDNLPSELLSRCASALKVNV